MRVAELILVVAVIIVVGAWLLRKGAGIAAEDQRRVMDDLRDLDGQWVRLDLIGTGRRAIAFPIRRAMLLPIGQLDSRTLDQGYVVLTAGEPVTFQVDLIHAVTKQSR